MADGATLHPGVWGILATPFHEAELAVDHTSLAALVRHYGKVGATGVVAHGVLGEAARLAGDERREVLETVVGAAGDRPVVAGVCALSTAPAVEEARQAAAGGARAVMVLVNTPDPARLAEHLVAIAGASGLGIVLQDHPLTTGVAIAPAALAEAVERSGAVVAIKAEGPPTAIAIATVAPRVDVPIFGGLGGIGLLDELVAGSAGAMTGFAFPEALIATVRAWREDGYAAAAAAYAPYLPLVVCEAQDKVSLAIRKEILRRRGLIADAAVRPPGAPLPDAAGALLDAHLAALSAGEPA